MFTGLPECRRRLSKTTFEGDFFRDMLRAQNPSAVFLGRRAVKCHVASELILFEIALEWLVELLWVGHEGNPFA